MDSAPSCHSSVPGTPSSVGTQQAREELHRLDSHVGHLVDTVMNRAVHPSQASSPALTRRSVGSSVGSVGTVQARGEMARLGGDIENMLDDVMDSVMSACTYRSGSTVASGQAREELAQIHGRASYKVDEVVGDVVRSFPTARSGASARSAASHPSRPGSASRRGAPSPSSVGTVEGREVLARINGDMEHKIDDILGGVFEIFPDSSRGSTAPCTPLGLEMASPGANSLDGGEGEAPGIPWLPGARQSSASESLEVPRVKGVRDDSNFLVPQITDAQTEQRTSPATSSLAAGTLSLMPQRVLSGSKASSDVKPLVAQPEKPVETDEQMFRRERRRLRRSDRVYVRHYEATFVEAQTRPSSAAQEEEVTREWDEDAAAAAATAAEGLNKFKLTGQASWKKLKVAVQSAGAFSDSWIGPMQRMSPESLTEFADAVRKDLEDVLDQVCQDGGHAEPLQDIVHKERAREARQLAAQSPQGVRVRPGMGAEKTRQMLEKAAKEQTNGLTRPTFSEMVSWRCHQKLWRKRSKELVGNGGRPAKQLLSKVREGMQTILLLGERGSGKSALVSRLVRRFSHLTDAGWIVLAHHAGAGNAEFSIQTALHRFCGELCQHLRINAPIPEGTNGVHSHLRELLIKATSLYGANILLVFDGYDQMDSVDFTHSHTWIPQGEILGLHIVLTLEEKTACYTRVLSRVDTYAEIKMSPLEEMETQELAERQLSQLLPGFEPSDLPLKDLVNASQKGLRPPLWMTTACRVIRGLVELYGFTQFPPGESQDHDAAPAPLACSPSFARASSRLGSRGSRRSRGSSRPSKLLVPGSTLHATICDLIRQQWSKDWADIAALLDSLIVAMEQVFSVDLVRDMLSLVVASPAGLDQLDLLTMLGYGYPTHDLDQDDYRSANTSPQLSQSPQYSAESSPKRGGATGATPSSVEASSVELSISAGAFGYAHPSNPAHFQTEDSEPAETLETLVSARSKGQRIVRLGLWNKIVGPWTKASRSRVCRAAGTTASEWANNGLAHAGMLVESEKVLVDARCLEMSVVVVSGGAFGHDHTPGHKQDLEHGHNEHEHEEHHGVGQVQDSGVFTRLLRCGLSLPGKG